MSDFVPTIDTLGDGALTDSILDRSITEFLDNLATSIGGYAFYNCFKLTSVSLSAATSIGDYAFYSCSALTSVSLPAATSIGGYAFSGCSALTSVSLPVATSIGSYAFQSCSALTSISLPAATSIGSYAFYRCSKLEALILENADAVCQLSGTSAFSGTPIASGTGYIYVPSALVDTYKAATNWSTYANQIRAIEDYPEICGTSE